MLIFDGVNKLRNTGIRNQDLSELQVCLSPLMKKDIVTAVIVDNNNTSCHISLIRSGSSSGYEVFSPDMTTPINLLNGICTFHLFLIDTADSSSEKTLSTKIEFNFDKYNEHVKKRILADANSEIQKMYEKIYKLTELNIQISEAINKETDMKN